MEALEGELLYLLRAAHELAKALPEPDTRDALAQLVVQTEQQLEGRRSSTEPLAETYISEVQEQTRRARRIHGFVCDALVQISRGKGRPGVAWSLFGVFVILCSEMVFQWFSRPRGLYSFH